MLRICALLPALLLAGCGDDPTDTLADQDARLERFVKENPYGDWPDAWLFKKTVAGPARIALVFGLGDNMKACEEIAEARMQRYTQTDFYCAWAN